MDLQVSVIKIILPSLLVITGIVLYDIWLYRSYRSLINIQMFYDEEVVADAASESVEVTPEVVSEESAE